jgi:hypothetical protein
MSAANDILQHIRQAAAHETAATRHEDRYEQQMKSAGASMYQAFCIALRASEQFHGRKIDDKAVLRIYQSTAPRKWWDEHLKAAKYPSRDEAKRLIQWHVDPAGAQARRAQHVLSVVASRKKLEKQRGAETRGSTLTPKPAMSEAKHAERITEGNVKAALAGRELPRAVAEEEHAAPVATREDLLGEVNRISAAVRKVRELQRDAVLEILRVTAREIERFA